jgi:FLYWCH zinc finger domain
MAYIQRGIGRGYILVHDGYRYQRHRKQSANLIWRCWRRSSCNARMKTNIFDPTIQNPQITILSVRNKMSTIF